MLLVVGRQLELGDRRNGLAKNCKNLLRESLVLARFAADRHSPALDERVVFAHYERVAIGIPVDGNEDELVDVVQRKIRWRCVGERGEVGENVLPSGARGKFDIERPHWTDRSDDAALEINW